MQVRTLRIARTASLMVSTAFSSSAKFQLCLIFRPGRDHDGLFLILDRLQKISSVMNGMYGCSSFRALDQNGLQCPAVLLPSCVSSSLLQTRFYHLDVPVAELLPDEIVNLLYGDAQLVLVHVFGHILCQAVDLGQDPACLPSVRSSEDPRCRTSRFLHVHHDKTGCVPYLVGKVPAGLHTLPVETHVVAGCVTGHQRQTQRICAVFVDHFQRIDTVAQGFTHLSSLAVTNQTVDQYGVERDLSGLLQSRRIPYG